MMAKKFSVQKCIYEYVSLFKSTIYKDLYRLKTVNCSNDQMSSRNFRRSPSTSFYSTEPIRNFLLTSKIYINYNFLFSNGNLCKQAF